MSQPKIVETSAAPGAPDPSRREFLSGAATAALSAAAVVAGAGGLRVAYPSVQSEGALVLGRVEVAPGSLVFVPEHGLFLTRTGEGLGAFSARCTHLGCTVRESGQGLLCPCHGARYDRAGRVVVGPARRDLPWLAVRVLEGGTVLVDPQTRVETGAVTALVGGGRR